MAQNSHLCKSFVGARGDVEEKVGELDVKLELEVKVKLVVGM